MKHICPSCQHELNEIDNDDGTICYKECEIIMRRKARRLDRAYKQLCWLKGDIAELVEDDKSKKYLLDMVDTLLKVTENYDKEDCIWNM